jgi:hypothetical protein
MNTKDIIALVVFGVITLVCLAAAYRLVNVTQEFGSSYSDLYGNCEVTETIVTVGHQVARQVLAQSSSRQWAIIQQPLNGTNTPYISFVGPTTTIASFRLASTSLVDVPHFTFGMGTDIKTGNGVWVRNDNGSSTIKVIQCDGRVRY